MGAAFTECDASHNLSFDGTRLPQDKGRACGEIDAERTKKRMLSASEFAQLTATSVRLEKASIWVDEDARQNVLSLRAKCRRQALKDGLDYVMIDYLQLMDGEGKTTEQQVSFVSRGIKQLAKEMHVPVIVLSQLNRNSEGREGHRPRNRDHTHKRCVSADTRLIDAKTGRWTCVSQIKPGDSVLGVIGNSKIVSGPVADVWSTGVKPVLKLTTRTGKILKATANHPVLTDRGWRHLGELKGNELIASPKSLPPHGAEHEDRADLCRFLGYMAGNGTCLRHREVGIVVPDKDAFAEVLAIVNARWPEVHVTRKRDGDIYNDVSFARVYENGFGKPGGNPMREWLREVGFFGARHCEKHVPDFVFESGASGARAFLAGYLATDGCCKIHRMGWTVHYDTTSLRLATDTQALLLRIGVVSTIAKPAMNSMSTIPIYRLGLSSSPENLRAFAEQVKVPGYRGRRLERMLASLPSGRCNSYVDGLPLGVSCYASHVTDWRDQGKRMRRAVCASFAESTGDPVLRQWADSQLLWEDIRLIEPAGEEEVWDISIPGVHTFLANGIVVHNSGMIE